MVDPLRDLTGAASQMPPDTIRKFNCWLDRRGLTFGIRKMVGGIYPMKIAVNGRLFAPCGHGDKALVIAVHDDPLSDCSEIIDLVAWRPSDPTEMYLRTGAAEALGLNFFDGCEVFGVTVFENIENWLRQITDSQYGIFILDIEVSWFLLQNVATIHCETPALALQIESAMERHRPGLPQFTVPRGIAA